MSRGTIINSNIFWCRWLIMSDSEISSKKLRLGALLVRGGFNIAHNEPSTSEDIEPHLVHCATPQVPHSCNSLSERILPMWLHFWTMYLLFWTMYLHFWTMYLHFWRWRWIFVDVVALFLMQLQSWNVVAFLSMLSHFCKFAVLWASVVVFLKFHIYIELWCHQMSNILQQVYRETKP